MTYPPTSGPVFLLPGFRFEPESRQLWSAGVPVRLRPKSADVLSVLIAHAGQVVGKSRLLAEVWPDGFVGEAALTVCVNELRHALGDDSRQPRFIATVHRRGYQLVAALSGDPTPTEEVAVLAGRTAELAILRTWWERADSGAGTVGFVVGSAGTGKTALLQQAVRTFDPERRSTVVTAQCVRQRDGGEAYRPVLEALAELAGGPHGAQVRDVLQAVAPSWWLRLPSLHAAVDHAALRGRAGRSAEARMPRELGDLFERLTRDRLLVLVLDDVHEADVATAELLGYLARRSPSLRLLLLGGYRPSDLAARRHPLGEVVADLQVRRLCRTVETGALTRAETETYLASRTAPRRPSAQLVEEVFLKTEGHPLFLTTLTETLLEQGMPADEHGDLDVVPGLADLGLPEAIQRLVEAQLDGLTSSDRRLLAVGAEVGTEFTVAAVAAGLDLADAEVEDRLGELAETTALVVVAGAEEWPDGTVTARYRLTHAGYRHALLRWLGGPARQAVARHRIADRVRGTTGPQTVGAKEFSCLREPVDLAKDFGSPPPLSSISTP